MSPAEALASPVFLFYMGLALGLLVVAGVILAGLRWGLGKPAGHAGQAYRGWLLMIPLLGLAVFLGRETTIGFFTLVALFGFKEFARATGL